jgi:hypothetical protein
VARGDDDDVAARAWTGKMATRRRPPPATRARARKTRRRSRL